MSLHEYTRPQALERYSFLWSQARLVIAALALFLGGVPPLVKFGFFPAGLTYSILIWSWIISGLASGYLLYRWHEADHKLFGTHDTKDRVAFLVSVVSGLNLGYAGISHVNLGMAAWSGSAIFTIVGLLYLASAWHLYKRWEHHGKRLF